MHYYLFTHLSCILYTYIFQLMWINKTDLNAYLLREEYINMVQKPFRGIFFFFSDSCCICLMSQDDDKGYMGPGPGELLEPLFKRSSCSYRVRLFCFQRISRGSENRTWNQLQLQLEFVHCSETMTENMSFCFHADRFYCNLKTFLELAVHQNCRSSRTGHMKYATGST